MIDGVLSFSPEEELRLITVMAYQVATKLGPRWRVPGGTPPVRLLRDEKVADALQQAVFERLLEMS